MSLGCSEPLLLQRLGTVILYNEFAAGDAQMVACLLEVRPASSHFINASQPICYFMVARGALEMQIHAKVLVLTIGASCRMLPTRWALFDSIATRLCAEKQTTIRGTIRGLYAGT